MKPTASAEWLAANQRHLMAALRQVRQTLRGWLQRTAKVKAPVGAASEGSSAAEPVSGPEPRAAAPTGQPFALDRLGAAFGLSPFERDVLLLCAGPDLDAQFTVLLGQANGDARRTQATFSLALAALPGAHWSALSPAAPLRRWRLIELGAAESLTGAPLRIDEAVLHFLAGVPHLDERLQVLMLPVASPVRLPDSQRALADRIVTAWTSCGTSGPPVLVQLCGESPDDQFAVAAAAAATMGCQLQRLRAFEIPAAPAERETLARLCERETALSRQAFLVDGHDLETPESARLAQGFLENATGLVLVAAREPWRSLGRRVLRFEVPRLAAPEQHWLWQEALGSRAAGLDGQLERVCGHFCFTANEVEQAATQLQLTPPTANEAPLEPGPSESSLWNLCRVQARSRLESLAQRLEPAATWEDLVLPEAPMRTLREVAAHVRQRFQVYEQWGFARRGCRGLGITALFAGASGTGKTMAAEVLAGELQLDLYRIDLSAVVSKYIGETEKNLRRVFDAAESGGAILVFDEADALFGKRSEVKDSHDRYANVEISYLLQRMEAYRGLAILTTNLKNALDAAFLRRIRFVIQFPFPDAVQRADIWRRVFPPATPIAGLEPAQLARLKVAGGHIRNIALNAAFLAADAGDAVRMTHLLQAARSECAKLERPPSEAELGGWT